jgi:hypothetical protein
MQQPQCPELIGIILQFIGCAVGVLAVGSNVLQSVVTIITDQQMGLYAR